MGRSLDVPGANDPPADSVPADPVEPAQSASAPTVPAGAMSERVELVVGAAERAAAGIREDAREQARRYLEDSRARADRMTMERVRLMSELTDALVRQAASVKQRSDRLLAALDEAAAQLESAGPRDASTAGATGESLRPERAPLPASGEEPPPPAPPSTAEPAALRRAEEARLLAVQMAVAGSGRAEIEARLRGELGVTDAGALLDEVVGPERQ